MRLRRVTVLCALMACGGGSIPFEQLNTELFKALCAKYAQCGLVHSESSCNAEYDGVVINDYSAAIAAGKIKYDGAAARTCLNGLAQSSCSALSLSADDTCDRVYEGQGAVGTACASSAECVSSAYCAEMMSGMVCSGTCTTRVAAGGMATSTSACEEGLRVSGGVCTKPPAEGEACSTTSGCAGGLLCGADLKCKKPGEEGASCDRTNACVTFFACVSGTCRKPLGVGESCATTDAGTPACKLDLYCDPATRLCGERGGDGAACSSRSACRDPLVCTNMGSTAGTCRSPTPEGQSCAMVPCDGKTYCESSSKLCRKRIAAGQPCPSGTQCESSSFCNNGTCQSVFSSCP